MDGRRESALVAMVPALVFGLALDVGAQQASLSEFLTEAEDNNPKLVAARSAAEAAAARVPQAGALPDPALGLGVMNVPVASPSLGRDRMTMTTVQLGGRLPWPGKLALAENAARLGAEAAEWEVERVRQRVRSEVKSAYYRVYFLDRALEVTGRNERLVADFAGLTSAQYAVGTGAQPDVLKAQVERTRLQDQVVALRERRTSAVARLNALATRATDAAIPAAELPASIRAAAVAGDTSSVRFAAASLADVIPEAGTGVVPGIPTVAELQRLAAEHNPALRAHALRVAAQERRLMLARKATLPDVSLSLGYSRRADFGDLFNVVISVPVPVFAGRKQGQAVIEQTARLAERRATYDARLNELEAEIAALAAELRRARDQLVLLDQGILPQARTSLASATASYRVGRVDFLTLLDAQVTLYQKELDYHRLLADFATNLAALERAVGTEVLK